MHDPASPLIEDWSGLIEPILGDLDVDELARSTRALLRRRGVPDARSLLRLALARGPGGLSLRETAAWAHLAGVADLTDASLNDRLHQSCDFLSAIMAAMLRAKTPGSSFRWPGRVLRISDGSCVSKPGSRGTDWRVHAVYDLGAGGFSNLELTDKTAAKRSIAALRSKEKYFSAIATIRPPKRCAASSPARKAESADYLVRLRWSSLRLRRPTARSSSSSHICKICRRIRTSTTLARLIDGAGAPNIPKPHHHRPMRSDNLCDLLFRQNLFPLPRVALAEKRLGGLRPLIEAAFGLLPGQRREEGFFDRRAKLHRPRFETQKARQTREAAFRRAASRSS